MTLDNEGIAEVDHHRLAARFNLDHTLTLQSLFVRL